MTRCQGCTNNCHLTINNFSGGRQFITGNRCERGLGKEKKKEDFLTFLNIRFNRLFDYKPLDEKRLHRGTVGIPRVLNMYENYPFWFTFFTKLGFQRCSFHRRQAEKIYELGIESIPSESECYPAKLAHGHIMHGL